MDIYVDAQNIGFDITPEMADYENVVAFDLSGIKTNSDTLAINMQSEFLEKVVNNMGSDSIHVLTVYVLMFKTEVTKIKYSGKRGNTFIPLQKRPGGIIYYGLDDLSGKGHPFYCDSYYENLDEYFYKKTYCAASSLKSGHSNVPMAATGLWHTHTRCSRRK